MKTEIKKVYKCDFCRRLYQVKNAAIKHEIRCFKNPANNPACFGCQNLKRVDVTLYHDGYNGECKSTLSTFFCSVKQQHMHLPISKHKGTVADLVEFTNEPMPMVCELRKGEWDNIDHTTSKFVQP